MITIMTKRGMKEEEEGINEKEELGTGEDKGGMKRRKKRKKIMNVATKKR